MRYIENKVNNKGNYLTSQHFSNRANQIGIDLDYRYIVIKCKYKQKSAVEHENSNQIIVK